MDTLFTVAFSGSESDGLVQFDDFYLNNNGGFVDSIPVDLQATEFLAEVESPVTEPEPPVVEPPVVEPPVVVPPVVLPPVPGQTPGEITGIVANADCSFTISYTGTLQSSSDVTGEFTTVDGATSPFTVNPGAAGDIQFYIAR